MILLLQPPPFPTKCCAKNFVWKVVFIVWFMSSVLLPESFLFRRSFLKGRRSTVWYTLCRGGGWSSAVLYKNGRVENKSKIKKKEPDFNYSWDPAMAWRKTVFFVFCRPICFLVCWQSDVLAGGGRGNKLNWVVYWRKLSNNFTLPGIHNVACRRRCQLFRQEIIAPQTANLGGAI